MTWVVIFRAQVKAQDPHYSAMAQRMRELALNEFGCLAFHCCTEGDQEIALSYWPDEASILAWRHHAEHVAAQREGRAHWYGSYQVEVAQIQRAYRHPSA